MNKIFRTFKKRNEVCERCSNFSYKYDEAPRDYTQMMLDYEKLMLFVLKKEFGINRKAAKGVIEALGWGNWEHLALTEEEETTTLEDMAEHLRGDIFYCQDRWTWDRVLRINWLYLRLKNNFTKIG